jgi:hypothetical protein
LICDCIGIVGLSIIGALVASFKHLAIFGSIAVALYFGGAFVLIVAVPQFYRRKKPHSDLQTGSMMFGFYGWFGNNSEGELDNTNKDFQLYQNDGFWLGIMLFIGGFVLLFAGAVVDTLFFGK